MFGGEARFAVRCERENLPSSIAFFAHAGLGPQLANARLPSLRILAFVFAAKLTHELPKLGRGETDVGHRRLHVGLLFAEFGVATLG